MAQTLQALATPSDLRQRLLSRLAYARAQTDDLFQIVWPEAVYDRPIPERHRIIFYLGHLEAFDWNLLGRQALGIESFHPEFDRLFAFGIDPVDGGLPNDQPSDWPARPEIERYNARVRQSLDDRLEKISLDDPALPLFVNGRALHVAIEHRLMHAETFAYMLHQLPLERKLLKLTEPVTAPRVVVPQMARIPAGTATLGLRRDCGEFGWDNEFEAHSVNVPQFEIDVHNVTNGQFLEFIRAGGYEERSFWDESSWDWKAKSGITHPTFWKRQDDGWSLRTMFAEIPLPEDWPVYVSHAEASAYMRWAGKTLPTEAQFLRAAYGTPRGVEHEFPWGDELPGVTRGNFDFRQWDPIAVGTHPAGQSAFGVADLVGNGWEWTSSLFEPFPGFQPFPFYPGYSANFFDGKHYVAKGGSPRTAACLLRKSFRNWFQPHYPYVYTTFRGVTNGR